MGNAPDATTGQDVGPGIAATTWPEMLEEHAPDLLDHELTGEDVPGNVEPSAAPAAEPLEGVGEPVEASELVGEGQEGQPVDPRGPDVLGSDVRQLVGGGVNQVRSLVGPAALSVGTARGGADHVDQPKGDSAGDQLQDAEPGDLPVLSDRAWAWMEPLLPSSTGRRGGRWRDHRQVVEAICWKYRTGSTWRQLPTRFGPWRTAYERLTKWSADGTWARLLAQAQTDPDAAGELDWLVAVHSTVVRVHQHGAGARRVDGDAATASADDREDGAAA